MSKLFTQLSGPADDKPAENQGAAPAPTKNTQLELELPGTPPQAQASPPPPPRRARKPAADDSALRDVQSKLTDAQAALARNEEALASARGELTTESEARQKAQADSIALQKDIQALKEQSLAAAAERDQLKQSLAELRAKPQPAPDFQSRQEELARQQQDLEARIRKAEAAVAQSREALAAEQRSRAEERRQAAAREQGLKAQLLDARRSAPRTSAALFGRTQETRGIKPVAIAVVVVLAAGIVGFLLGRHPTQPSGDYQAMADAIPAAAPGPVAEAAPMQPVTEPAAISAEAGPGGGHVAPAPAAAASAVLPVIELKGLQAKQAGEGVRIVFDKGVFSRRATLSGEACILLKQLAEQLRPALSSYRLEITGHTDPEPVRGDAVPDNQALGYQRAQVVADYLATKCSVPAEALSVASAGDVGAPYPNTTPEMRRKNRTVTIVVMLR